MKMKSKNLILILFTLFVLSSCENIEKDTESPVITEINFPQNCDTLYRGSTFTYRLVALDNNDLGSYSVELHNNFDHHTHSTSSIECIMDEDKSPVNPFYYNEDFEVPVKLWEYVIEGQISIPSDVDPGDYHFEIKVTDEAGWQTYEGISVKIV